MEPSRGSFSINHILGRVTVFFLVLVCSVFSTNGSFTPAYGANKKLTMSTCRSLAIKNSSAYESAEMAVDSKRAAMESAVKSLKLKKKKLTTFSWSPLLKFHFPERLNFAQESEFELKPLKLRSDVDVAQHKVQDVAFSINEEINLLYTEIVTLQENMKFHEKQVEQLESGVERNRAKLKVGEATKTDVERLEKKLKTLNQTMAADKRKLEADLKKLTKKIGLDVTTGYDFQPPFLEATIDRTSLPGLIQYTEDRDHSYYEACASEATAKLTLNTNYGFIRNKYGGDSNIIAGYVQQALNGQKVSSKAFKNSYKSFLDKIDSYWAGSFKIIFFRISREWTKGSLDGTRYIDDDPYVLYENVLDYISARNDQIAAKEAVDQSVEESFNNYISVRASYKNLRDAVNEKQKQLDEYAAKNKMGLMTLEEYTDEVDAFEELQNSMLDAMKLYTTTLYSFDRLTCGGVSKLFEGTDMDLQTAVVGESYVKKDSKDAQYFLKPIIQRELFELSIFVPEGFPVNITDFELWCDGIQIGEKTAVDGKIRHLALSRQSVNDVKIRLYDGDTFIDDCKIDANEESGVLHITTAMEVQKEETGEVGSYSTEFNDLTGFLSLTITPLETEEIGFFRLLLEDGTALLSKDPLEVEKKFTYLGLMASDLEKLTIEFYDKDKKLKYTGYFDTTNQTLKKQVQE
ncbi:MAG: TolC family protein [Lachnospiraceae bacterium]|nr:TolC family protein [Lachnospiraceae bacterium]